MKKRPVRISVIGAGNATDEEKKTAFEVGRELALNGCILITGGLGGVMEAASRGAREAGGTVIGVLPGDAPDDANGYVDIPLPTAMGRARNVFVVRFADGVIAVGGKIGTLNEISFALIEGRPVVGLHTWDLDVDKTGGKQVIKAEDASEAVKMILKLAADGT